VLLAAHYQLQTNPITQPRVRYIHTAMPHASYTLHCASCPILPSPKKEICFSLTGDINAQSSHWNNGKMKIAHNSAYVRIETFDFTFTQHAIIVYVYLCSNFQEIAPRRMSYNNKIATDGLTYFVIKFAPRRLSNHRLFRGLAAMDEYGTICV